MDIRIVDTLSKPFTNSSNYYVKPGSKPLYKVWLYLEGVDLPYVERVTYRLHKSFRSNEHTIERTIKNPNCQMVIWTWGLFQVSATVRHKNGRSYKVLHQLKYNEQLPGLIKIEIT